VSRTAHNPDSVDSRFLEPCDAPLTDLRTDPFIMVIVGGTGDLSKRKLLPTLCHLSGERKFEEPYCVLAVGRRQMTDDQYQRIIRTALEPHIPRLYTTEIMESFCNHLVYLPADLQQRENHPKFCGRVTELTGLKKITNLVYYLAVPPEPAQVIVENLAAHHFCGEQLEPKLVIEKPFGSDRTSAAELNRFILKYFQEHQIYRIDHYLGKETVQNILFFRFGNSIFEPLWNRNYIDHVQITVAEDIGIGTRGAFYEQAGVVRDIVQNHMMQLLALVAMEPPSGFEADLVRDEKVKVYRAVRPMDEQYIDRFTVRGQYGPGRIGDKRVAGYRQEKEVAADSSTATYFAGKFYLDNWRWAGVPFYLRTGKRLAQRLTEIYIELKQPPLRLLGRTCDTLEPSSLLFSIQPAEQISLRLNVKYPGVDNVPHPVYMDFNYAESFKVKTHPAYERLLVDILKGDLTLFARADEVEAMWEVVDPIIARWRDRPAEDFPNYAAGTWGPARADDLLGSEGRRWKAG